VDFVAWNQRISCQASTQLSTLGETVTGPVFAAAMDTDPWELWPQFNVSTMSHNVQPGLEVPPTSYPMTAEVIRPEHLHSTIRFFGVALKQRVNFSFLFTSALPPPSIQNGYSLYILPELC
jgi:hypothetical protein